MMNLRSLVALSLLFGCGEPPTTRHWTFVVDLEDYDTFVVNGQDRSEPEQRKAMYFPKEGETVDDLEAWVTRSSACGETKIPLEPHPAALEKVKRRGRGLLRLQPVGDASKHGFDVRLKLDNVAGDNRRSVTVGALPPVEVPARRTVNQEFPVSGCTTPVVIKVDGEPIGEIAPDVFHRLLAVAVTPGVCFVRRQVEYASDAAIESAEARGLPVGLGTEPDQPLGKDRIIALDLTKFDDIHGVQQRSNKRYRWTLGTTKCER